MKEIRAYVHSMEGDIYLLEIEKNGVSEWVTNKKDDHPRRFASLACAKDFAKKKGARDIQVGVEAPYEEMIGIASNS